MSNLPAALAAAFQNDSTISALITGVIPEKNFDLQDEKITTSPFACIMIEDLTAIEQPYIGTTSSGDVIASGQIEVRCISASSKQKAKELAALVKTYLWTHRGLTLDGTIPLAVSNILHSSDIEDDPRIWIEILTVDYCL